MLETTARYLDLPWRHRHLDRLFVDALVAMEIGAFTREMHHETEFVRAIRGWSVDLRPWKWTGLTILETLLVFAAIVGALVFAVWQDWVAAGPWLVWVIGGLGLLAALRLAFSILVILPRAIWVKYLGMKKMRQMEDAMSLAYESLAGDRVSVRHVRHLLEKAAEAGVSWPSKLFVLLDDLEARGERTLR